MLRPEEAGVFLSRVDHLRALHHANNAGNYPVGFNWHEITHEVNHTGNDSMRLYDPLDNRRGRVCRSSR